MYLNLTTVDLFWLKGVLETQSMHIYIYTDIKSREVIRCCKHMLFAFSHAYGFSFMYIIQSQCSTSIALSQPLCSLASGFYVQDATLRGGINAWIKACIRSASAGSIHTCEPLRQCCEEMTCLIQPKEPCWSNI